MQKPESVLETETHKILWDFKIQTDRQISTGRPDRVIINKKWKEKKKRTFQILDFPDLTDHRVKIKENEKRNKYINLAREVKKLWNLKVMVIPIINGALRTVSKDWKSWKSEEQPRPSKLQPEYWEESLWLEEICSHFDSGGRLSRSKIIILTKLCCL